MKKDIDNIDLFNNEYLEEIVKNLKENNEKVASRKKHLIRK